MASATAIVSTVLDGLLTECWGIPRPLRKRLLHVILHSTCERATRLRWQLALVGHADLDGVFQRVITPPFAIALIEDLCALVLFPRQDASHIQECILGAVDRNSSTWII
jgi:hypothetical protein